MQPYDETSVSHRGTKDTMFIEGLGYGTFRFEVVARVTKCPICHTREIDIRNMAFIHSKWKIVGVMRKTSKSKVTTEGRTYDEKMHTFKEMDYKDSWKSMEITVD